MYLEVSNLSKFFGNTKVLNNISFSINEGEVVSLVGASGSGKSTLLRCIAGLHDFPNGTITLNSKILNNVDPSKRKISFVFQDSPLFPHINIIENILFNLKKIDNDLLEILLNDLNLLDLKEKYPHEISGGENQRVAVARSLIRKPDLLLLDEPFNHLDVMIKNKLKEIVLSVIAKTNVTTIFVNHNMRDPLEISDRILVIQNGQISDFNSPQMIYNNPSDIYTAKLFSHINMISLNDQTIYLRPEHISITATSNFKSKVISSVFLGDKYMIKASFGEYPIIFFHVENIEKNKIVKINFNIKKQLKFS